ncbi:transcriptional regulator [Vibrio sp. TBV020]|uniref:winged helix-turn-helix domain-containing protein n=1 Tax=Vibrio sp. TBV020 TaxID=3137398 RepID=UPI0038CD520E
MLLINDTHVLDEASGFIHSLKSQIRHPIGINEISLLSYMFTNSGKVLSKQELMDEVWLKRGIIVESSSLLHSISSCRRGLEDKAAEVIRTERGVGYEFTGSVKRIECMSEVIAEPTVDKVEEPIQLLEADLEAKVEPVNRSIPYIKVLGICIAAMFVSFVVTKQLRGSALISGYQKTTYDQCTYTPNSTGESVFYQSPALYQFEKLTLLVDKDGRSVSFSNDSEVVDCE